MNFSDSVPGNVDSENLNFVFKFWVLSFFISLDDFVQQNTLVGCAFVCGLMKFLVYIFQKDFLVVHMMLGITFK
jgi:hypothetical protein